MKKNLFGLFTVILLTISCNSKESHKETTNATSNKTLKLENTKWQLVALFVSPIETNPEDYYLILDSKERKAYAKANCNLLNLSYVIENQNRLLFQDGNATETACPDDTENRLLRALQETDYFEINADELYFFKDKQIAPLAKFKGIR